MSWLINLSGLALMALIVWWFGLAGAGKADAGAEDDGDE